MDPAWTLDLLSTRGLDQSILLTVLLGLWIMLFFSETLGWVFIGVVVPGYLASVMVISPTSAVAILCEAIVTLVIARAFAVTLARTGIWTQFFGRDRFFLIVLVSVWVRQFNQSLALPALEQFLRTSGYPSLALTEDFSSIGLVLIPLTANMFWRQNLARGLLHFGTIVGLTYVLLRWVLLPYTNLTDASLVLLYEDSAIDFMSNAKSYIVLLVSAYLASLVNLRYGWDFGGILIAALLSLLWWTPIKLFLTLLEALLLYAATAGALRLPWLRKLNLEGPRKIAVIFSYAFALKCLLGALIGDAFPGLKVTDLFAFGYLMSSILAVRIFVVGSARRVLLPVLLTSALGFVLSSLLGLLLDRASKEHFERASSGPAAPQLLSTRSLKSVQGALSYAAARRNSASSDLWNHTRPSTHKLWRELAHALGTPSLRLPESWLGTVRVSTWKSQVLDQPDTRRITHLLHPGEDQDGNPLDGPMALIRQDAIGPVLVAQWSEQHAGLAQATWLECLRNDCGLVLFFSRHAKDYDSGLAPHLSRSDHALLDRLRRRRPIWHVVFSDKLQSGEKILHLDGSASGSELFLRQDLAYRWNPAPELEDLEASRSDRVLRLSPQDPFATTAQHWDLGLKTLDHPGLSDYLQSRRLSVLGRDTDTRTPSAPSPLSATELRILEKQVVRPLLELNAQGDPDPHSLAAISFAAQPLGAQLAWLPVCGRSGCFVLTLDDREQGLVWVLARDYADQSDVEVPRPSREPGILGLGSALFLAHELRSLLVHMGDWQHDPTHAGNIHTAYHAIHQGLDGHPAGDTQASLSIILRGIQASPAPTAEASVIRAGLGYPVLTTQERSFQLAQWSSAQGPLAFLGNIKWSDASPEHYRYSGAQIPQVRYSRLLGRKHPMVLWLPPSIRAPYIHQGLTYWWDLARTLDDPPVQRSQNKALQVIDELAFLHPHPSTPADCKIRQETSQLWNQALDMAERFAQFRHPFDLASLANKLRTKGVSRLSMLRGAQSGIIYLRIHWQTQGLDFRALINLGQTRFTRELLNAQDLGTLGPWPSLSLTQLQRSRTVMAVHCQGAR